MEEIRRLVTMARAPSGSLAEKHEAFDQIVRRFQDMAYGYAYAVLGDSDLAQDAAQEAFLAAWRSLAQLGDPEAFPAWFKRIVLSQCHRLTRGKRMDMVPLEAVLNVAAAETAPDVAAERSEMKARVLAAVQALPESERMAATLFYTSHFSYREIASFLDLPRATVKTSKLQYFTMTGPQARAWQ